jgi:AraC-like DNA-binding protein
LTKIEERHWPDLVVASNTLLTVQMMNCPFRFLAPEGWDTTANPLKEHLIYGVMRGRCKVQFVDQEIMMNAGDLCWTNPGTFIRLYWASGDSRPELYRFRFTVVANGRSLRLPWDRGICRAASEALEWARPWVQESQHPGVYAQARMKSLAVLFSLAFFEKTREGQGSLHRELSREMRADLMDWTTQNPSQRFKPSDLARRCGLSADYFTRLFRRSFKLNPKAWILKRRLQHAAGMLAESDRSISDIAAELGYDDLYLFSRQFKKELGLSPRVWRKSHRHGLA